MSPSTVEHRHHPLARAAGDRDVSSTGPLDDRRAGPRLDGDDQQRPGRRLLISSMRSAPAIVPVMVITTMLEVAVVIVSARTSDVLPPAWAAVLLPLPLGLALGPHGAEYSVLFICR